ncbi:hypothetical protein CVT24_010792 [Panaeolus cyanescens]|uniref:Uncharacterized protein n=1 Tax=Panaeolus cyanescens TaxID=181874 RepID=A0A409VGU2_9AGAR|nr:hypothetical protein CVT24_010792 [Panaeolus cyanescens]
MDRTPKRRINARQGPQFPPILDPTANPTTTPPPTDPPPTSDPGTTGPTSAPTSVPPTSIDTTIPPTSQPPTSEPTSIPTSRETTHDPPTSQPTDPNQNQTSRTRTTHPITPVPSETNALNVNATSVGDSSMTSLNFTTIVTSVNGQLTTFTSPLPTSLAAPPSTSSNGRTSLIAGVTGALIGLLIIILTAVFFWRRHKLSQNAVKREKEQEKRKEVRGLLDGEEFDDDDNIWGYGVGNGNGTMGTTRTETMRRDVGSVYPSMRGGVQGQGQGLYSQQGRTHGSSVSIGSNSFHQHQQYSTSQTHLGNGHPVPPLPPAVPVTGSTTTLPQRTASPSPSFLKSRVSGSGSVFQEHVWPPPNDVLSDPIQKRSSAVDLGGIVDGVMGRREGESAARGVMGGGLTAGGAGLGVMGVTGSGTGAGGAREGGHYDDSSYHHSSYPSLSFMGGVVPYSRPDTANSMYDDPFRSVGMVGSARGGSSASGGATSANVSANGNGTGADNGHGAGAAGGDEKVRTRPMSTSVFYPGGSPTVAWQGFEVGQGESSTSASGVGRAGGVPPGASPPVVPGLSGSGYEFGEMSRVTSPPAGSSISHSSQPSASPVLIPSMTPIPYSSSTGSASSSSALPPSLSWPPASSSSAPSSSLSPPLSSTSTPPLSSISTPPLSATSTPHSMTSSSSSPPPSSSPSPPLAPGQASTARRAQPTPPVPVGYNLPSGSVKSQPRKSSPLVRGLEDEVGR